MNGLATRLCVSVRFKGLPVGLFGHLASRRFMGGTPKAGRFRPAASRSGRRLGGDDGMAQACMEAIKRRTPWWSQSFRTCAATSSHELIVVTDDDARVDR